VSRCASNGKGVDAIDASTPTDVNLCQSCP